MRNKCQSSSEGIIKAGNQYAAITSWQGIEKKFRLITGRDEQGRLVTVLNEHLLYIHDCNEPSLRLIRKLHSRAKDRIVRSLKSGSKL